MLRLFWLLVEACFELGHFPVIDRIRQIAMRPCQRKSINPRLNIRVINCWLRRGMALAQAFHNSLNLVVVEHETGKHIQYHLIDFGHARKWGITGATAIATTAVVINGRCFAHITIHVLPHRGSAALARDNRHD
ncbi:hypothetical protein [Herpetosiphon giganteus]|uniref:hypothetical protein n=1 Tax=Herpetosiphon giganteus TaxID=2029754 RepID=UPI001EF7E1D5|nr:hypothetical protein [Herpetosiphon giganteus]